MNYFSTVVTLLRDRQAFLEEIHEGVKLKSKISALMISSFCFFAIYGAIIGMFHSPLQALASARTIYEVARKTPAKFNALTR